MTGNAPKNERLIGLFFFGCLLFNYPIISLFNMNAAFFGIPLLYLYLFLVWIGLIVLVMLVTRSGG